MVIRFLVIPGIFWFCHCSWICSLCKLSSLLLWHIFRVLLQVILHRGSHPHLYVGPRRNGKVAIWWHHHLWGERHHRWFNLTNVNNARLKYFLNVISPKKLLNRGLNDKDVKCVNELNRIKELEPPLSETNELKLMWPLPVCYRETTSSSWC